MLVGSAIVTDMLQSTALKILQTGVNVFLTGEPGTGKTYTINTYVAWLRERGIEPAITASTGIAATHIGGMTIHSWSGIGIKDHLDQYALDDIAGTKRVVDRVAHTPILIIDEISMLAGNTLSMVDQVCRAVRKNELPFGGIQVVLVGDFFQLPPIVRTTDDALFDTNRTAPFAFRAEVWQALNPIVCYLHEQFRQSDTSYARLLSTLRSGASLDTSSLDARVYELDGIPDTIPRLFTRNIHVDRLNLDRLREIKGAEREFVMLGRGSERLVDTLKRSCISPEVLYLRVGARVMCTKNDPAGRFVNGTLGEVIGFAQTGNPQIHTNAGTILEIEPVEWKIDDGGKTLARITQIPLRLAWAVTIHKSQGMTLDAAAIDLSDAFEYGQGYVALSRVRSFDGLYLLGYNERALRVHPEVREHDVLFKKNSAAARALFESMAAGEHTALVEQFVTSSGGSLTPGAIKKEKKKTVRRQRGGTLEATLSLAKEGYSIERIASERALTSGTIVSHIVELYMHGQLDRRDVEALVSDTVRDEYRAIAAAFAEHGTEKLAPVHAALGGRLSYDDLQLARILFL